MQKLICILALTASSLFGACHTNDCSPCDPCQTCDPCDTCCCNPCCCEPCDFVPPCPPDTCAYNAPVEIDIKCGCDFFLTGSFVYFQAKEENLEYINTFLITYLNESGSGSSGNDIEINSGKMCFDYEPAFRVGLGMTFGCDDWAFYAEYFRYHADVGTGSFFQVNSNNSDTELEASFLWVPNNNGGSDIVTPEVNTEVTANTKWRLEMDLVDFNLSRRYFVGRCLTFQPHFGLRAGWIDQKYTATYVSVGADGPRTVTFDVESSTESWAIGARAGINTDWKFCGCFFLFGNSAFSILYTDYDKITFERTHLREQEGTEDLHGTFTIPKRELCYLRPQLDIGLGLGWADYFCCNDWYFDLRAGYEFHTFWNQNMFPKTYKSAFDPLATGGDLYLRGLVITARLDF